MHEKDQFPDLPHELLRTQEGVSVEVSKTVAEEERAALWEMIQTGFTDLNNHSHEPQDMTYEEFVADAESPDVLKYIARDAQDKPIGYLTVHIGFDDISWTDPAPLAEVQSTVDSSANPYYIGTLVVPVDKRGTEAATTLLQGAFTHFDMTNTRTGQHSLVFFDCARANSIWLPQFLEKVGASAAGNYEGMPTEIVELYKEQLLASSEDDKNLIKICVSPDTQDSDEVLDTQHYYGVKIR